MKLAMTILLPVVVLTGCASAISERVATDYTQVGAAAEARGDWDTARRAFARAVMNADEAGLPLARRATVHYEYGRSLGVTCFFDQSEHELNVAYDLDRQTGQPLFLSLVELARLNLDQGKFVPAAAYFERAMPALDAVNAADKAPIAYAGILDEYARALTGAGRSQEARKPAERAASIRAGRPSGHSITDRTPYGKFCNRT